jgi:hypothetical protein
MIFRRQQVGEGYMRSPPSRLHLLTYALDFHNKQTALSCTVRRPITTTANVTTNGIAESCRCTTASRAGALRSSRSWQQLTFPIGQNLPYRGFHEASRCRPSAALGVKYLSRCSNSTGRGGSMGGGNTMHIATMKCMSCRVRSLRVVVFPWEPTADVQRSAISVWSLRCDRQAIVWGKHLGTNESSLMEHTRLVVRDLAKCVLTRPG